MNFVAHSLIFPTPRHVLRPEVLAQIRACGYSAVEVVPVEFSDADFRGLAAALRAEGLAAAIGWSLDSDANPIAPEAGKREAARLRARELIDQARLLGAPLVAGLLQAGCGYLTGAPPTEGELERAVEFYRDSCDYAARGVNVNLCFEPSTRSDSHLINTVAQGKAFLRRVQRPNAKMLLDTFQMLREEDDVMAAIELAGSDIGYVHASESHRGIVGSGTVPWAAVRAGLRAADYHGWVGVEAFADSTASVASRAQVWRTLAPSPLALLQRSEGFLRQLLQGASAA